jgi:nitroreductase
MSIIQAMHDHKSIRSYRSDPIPQALLTEILEAGIHASSSGNMQSYSIIVTRDRALREQLHQPLMQQRMVLEAPVLLTFCADFHRMRRWLELSDAPDNFDNFMSFMIAAIDAVLVSQNVALAAEARGLGICYMGSILANCDQVGAILQCPENVVPVVGFSLGYPDEEPSTRDRLPLDGLIHDDIYRDYSDDRIREIYKDRESAGWKRYMSYPRLRKLIEDAGVINLAQIYTTVKYSRASHLLYSENVLGYLKKQGFDRDSK